MDTNFQLIVSLVFFTTLLESAVGFFFFGDDVPHVPGVNDSSTNATNCLSIPLTFHGRWFTTLNHGNVLNIGNRIIHKKSSKDRMAMISSASQLVCYKNSVVYKNIEMVHNVNSEIHEEPMSMKNKCVMIRKGAEGRNGLTLKVTKKPDPLCNIKTFENDKNNREFVMSRHSIPDIIVTNIRCDYAHNSPYYVQHDQHHIRFPASTRRNCALMCHMDGFGTSFLLNRSDCNCISDKSLTNRKLPSCYQFYENNKIIIYSTQTRMTIQQHTQRKIKQATQLFQDIAKSFLSPLMAIHDRPIVNISHEKYNNGPTFQSTTGMHNVSKTHNVSETRNATGTLNSTSTNQTAEITNTTLGRLGIPMPNILDNHHNGNKNNTKHMQTSYTDDVLDVGSHDKMIMFMIPLGIHLNNQSISG